MEKELRIRLSSIESLLREDITSSISEIKEELQEIKANQKVLTERVNWHERIAKWGLGIVATIIGAAGVKHFG